MKPITAGYDDNDGNDDILHSGQNIPRCQKYRHLRHLRHKRKIWFKRRAS